MPQRKNSKPQSVEKNNEKHPCEEHIQILDISLELEKEALGIREVFPIKVKPFLVRGTTARQSHDGPPAARLAVLPVDAHSKRRVDTPARPNPFQQGEDAAGGRVGLKN